MLSGALAVIGLLFMGGLALGVMQSFGMEPLAGDYALTLGHYLNVVGDPRFVEALLLTLRVSIATTALMSVLAVVCALVLRQSLWGKKVVTFIFQLNIPIPHVMGAIAAIFLLSRSGLLSRLAFQMGLVEGPAGFPALVYDKNLISVILVYVWKGVSFTGIILLATLQSVGEDYEDLARTLGANRWQRVRYVLLPLIMPGLLRGAILVFAAVFSSYAIPFLLGASHPKALAVLAFEYYTNVDLGFRKEAMAMSTIMAILVAILVWVYMRLAAYVRKE
jgi:putative spermidine/putrescine transport system permease protein